ncbi:hypothetical protein EVAR_56578_1 [Eumeta japonica]|uniref:Uncharacterized protein n=1 Tax=Eumeta variegata TaxID=151549 RepID=A0A4C1Z090_EUMVA|nr:hypothetical protein EVAR_56578_1 [Eumeta japonica]
MRANRELMIATPIDISNPRRIHWRVTSLSGRSMLFFRKSSFNPMGILPMVNCSKTLLYVAEFCTERTAVEPAMKMGLMNWGLGRHFLQCPEAALSLNPALGTVKRSKICRFERPASERRLVIIKKCDWNLKLERLIRKKSLRPCRPWVRAERLAGTTVNDLWSMIYYRWCRSGGPASGVMTRT